MSRIASATVRTTALPFTTIACSPKLFQVNGDVPAIEALEAASLYLASALDMASDAVDENMGDGAFAVSYLIELAKAVVDSVSASLPRPEVQS
jgi:hypothetical protein